MKVNLTVYQFIEMLRVARPEFCYNFFSKENLKFFGERFSDMRILGNTKVVQGRECYVLSTYQRNNPSGPTRHHYYFTVDGMEILF